MTPEDSLCDALLHQYGMGDERRWQNWEGSLTEARDTVRNAARAIIKDLADDLFEIVEKKRP